MPQTFAMRPRGAFDLATEAAHFGGWPAYAPDRSAVAMAFPLEGHRESAAVVVRQPEPGTVTGAVHGVGAALAERAWEQALAVLSLDVDGSGFPAVGERDPVIGRLQEQHPHLRPVLFHSPYEAACNFVIGQRISMVQARALRRRMADEIGETVVADGVELAAFPGPDRLLAVREVRGLPAEKVTRLHGIAEAAREGLLDRRRLRALDPAAALTELMTLRGVGPFAAQGTLVRGAGLVDELTDEVVSKQAAQRLYGIDHLPSHDEMLELAQSWRPYRTWATVLLHVWIRSDGARVVPPGRPRRRAG